MGNAGFISSTVVALLIGFWVWGLGFAVQVLGGFRSGNVRALSRIGCGLVLRCLPEDNWSFHRSFLCV